MDITTWAYLNYIKKNNFIGGLKENVYWFMGEDAFVRQMKGEKHMYHYLERNKERIAKGKTSYLFVDALNCSQGCLYGTGCEADKVGDDSVLEELLNIKVNSKKNSNNTAWGRNLSPKQRLDKINNQFKNLDLNDYLRKYTDRSAKCEYKISTEEQRNNIFESMFKHTKQEQSINCSSCGYESCTQMTDAIFNGINKKENCIYYINRELEKETKQCQEMAKKLGEESEYRENRNRQIIETVQNINKDFEILHSTVDDMRLGNESNAQESFAISADIGTVSGSCDELSLVVEQIQNLLGELISNNEEVVDIASQTNLLALNASIEAARPTNLESMVEKFKLEN